MALNVWLSVAERFPVLLSCMRLVRPHKAFHSSRIKLKMWLNEHLIWITLSGDKHSYYVCNIYLIERKKGKKERWLIPSRGNRKSWELCGTLRGRVKMRTMVSLRGLCVCVCANVCIVKYIILSGSPFSISLTPELSSLLSPVDDSLRTSGKRFLVLVTCKFFYLLLFHHCS